MQVLTMSPGNMVGKEQAAVARAGERQGHDRATSVWPFSKSLDFTTHACTLIVPTDFKNSLG